MEPSVSRQNMRAITLKGGVGWGRGKRRSDQTNLQPGSQNDLPTCSSLQLLAFHRDYSKIKDGRKGFLQRALHWIGRLVWMKMSLCLLLRIVVLSPLQNDYRLSTTFNPEMEATMRLVCPQSLIQILLKLMEMFALKLMGTELAPVQQTTYVLC